MFFNKKKKILTIENKQDELFYRAKNNLIEQTLRIAKESNENPYTTIRKIRDIIYR